MKNPQRLELLNNEYTMLQQFYQDIDNRGLTIKGWSVTVSLAGIGAGLLYSGWIFLGVMGAALLFWYLEGYWRGLSFFFSRRILAIEAAIREGTWKEMDPLQIYHAWDEAYQVSGDQTFRYMLKRPSLWPHVLVAIISLLLFILAITGIINPLSG